jgi:hypothetical protein
MFKILSALVKAIVKLAEEVADTVKFGPDAPAPAPGFTHVDLPGPVQDAQALQGDWVRVGNDIAYVMGDAEKKEDAAEEEDDE